MIHRIVRKIKLLIWKKYRLKIDKRDRKRLTDKIKTTSIISMNCTGGIISHNLGL